MGAVGGPGPGPASALLLQALGAGLSWDILAPHPQRSHQSLNMLTLSGFAPPGAAPAFQGEGSVPPSRGTAALAQLPGSFPEQRLGQASCLRPLLTGLLVLTWDLRLALLPEPRALAPALTGTPARAGQWKGQRPSGLGWALTEPGALHAHAHGASWAQGVRAALLRASWSAEALHASISGAVICPQALGSHQRPGQPEISAP